MIFNRVFDVRRRARQDGERRLPTGQPPHSEARRRSDGATFDVEMLGNARSISFIRWVNTFSSRNPSNQTSNVERRTSNVEPVFHGLA
jgi:hypothetical protein